jgi:hypothetical protein
MFPTSFLITVVLGLAVGVIAVGLIVGGRAYLRYRGKMLITCPETCKPAAVKVAAGAAAVEAIFGRSDIHLKDCSRWPERQDCGQECLSQMEPDPKHCLVWTLVADWYAGKSCVYCQKPFGEIHWHDHQPALLSPDGKTLQWNEVPAEKLPDIFLTHSPVCWSCNIAETFRREHSELVVDRPWKRGPMGEFTQEEKNVVSKQNRVA